MPDFSTPPTLADRCKAAALAHEYLDHGPECAKGVDEYEWQIRPLGLGEMKAANLGPCNGIDPAQSGQAPVVVSYGDDEQTPLQVWDGVHRILSSIQTGEGGRLAAVGVRKEGVVRLDDLPEDLNDLVSSLFEDADLPIPDAFPTRAVRVDRFPDVELAHGIDDRGVKHADAMAGEYLPPVVVNGDVWMDGRHRIHQLKDAGVEWVLAIDLAGKLPAPDIGHPLNLGLLKPNIPENTMTLKNHSADDKDVTSKPLKELVITRRFSELPPTMSELVLAHKKKNAALDAVDQLTKPKVQNAP